MHLFHKWASWHVLSNDLKKRPPEWEPDQQPVMYQWYEIHERRVCLKCGRVEFRIRNSG